MTWFQMWHDIVIGKLSFKDAYSNTNQDENNKREKFGLKSSRVL